MQNSPLRVNARFSQSTKVPKIGVKPSPEATEYFKNMERRGRLQGISQICTLIIASIAYGFSMMVVCFALAYLFMVWNALLGDIISTMVTGYLQAFLPGFLASYSQWLMLGIPLLILGSQFAYAIATHTHGLPLHASSWLKTLIHVLGYSLPFVVFLCGLMYGAPLVPLLWTTWALGTLSGLYIMVGHELLNQFFPDENYSRSRPMPQEMPPPGQRERDQRSNTYLPGYDSHALPRNDEQMDIPENDQALRPRRSLDQF